MVNFFFVLLSTRIETTMAGYTKEERKERIKEDDEIKMNLGWLDFSKPHGQILLKTIWKVAGEESEEVQIAIAWVILNGANLNWHDLENTISNIVDVCKGDRQLFSFWKEDEDIVVPNEEQKNITSVLTKALAKGRRERFPPVDPTRGATSYFNHDGNPITLRPEFEPTVKIGKYQFYKERQPRPQ